jgi:hypothetical protein
MKATPASTSFRTAPASDTRPPARLTGTRLSLVRVPLSFRATRPTDVGASMKDKATPPSLVHTSPKLTGVPPSFVLAPPSLVDAPVKPHGRGGELQDRRERHEGPRSEPRSRAVTTSAGLGEARQVVFVVNVSTAWMGARSPLIRCAIAP